MSDLIKDKVINKEANLIINTKYFLGTAVYSYKGIVNCPIKIKACPVACNELIKFDNRIECFRNLSNNKLAIDTVFTTKEKEIV